jgi:hypothetical protein
MTDNTMNVYFSSSSEGEKSSPSLPSTSSNLSTWRPRHTTTRSKFVLFPVKLHKLLEHESKKGKNDVISWLQDGKSFKVHDKHRFANEIMAAYFETSKYKSFQKNLNIWEFKTVATSSSGYLPDRSPRTLGECYHPLFVRDFPALSERMKRVVAKNKNGKINNVKKNNIAPSLSSASSSRDSTETNKSKDKTLARLLCQLLHKNWW